MRAKGDVAIKRNNMVKSEHERLYYQLLSKVRRIIETRFSQLEEFGARLIRELSQEKV